LQPSAKKIAGGCSLSKEEKQINDSDKITAEHPPELVDNFYDSVRERVGYLCGIHDLQQNNNAKRYRRRQGISFVRRGFGERRNGGAVS
jgi:hypothetical protein